MCALHAGLGVGMASGSQSGEEKKTYINALRPNLFMMEREGKREGLFNWWWVGEKQRQEKIRGSVEWRKKSMRSSERNDDGAVETA